MRSSSPWNRDQYVAGSSAALSTPKPNAGRRGPRRWRPSVAPVNSVGAIRPPGWARAHGPLAAPARSGRRRGESARLGAVDDLDRDGQVGEQLGARSARRRRRSRRARRGRRRSTVDLVGDDVVLQPAADRSSACTCCGCRRGRARRRRSGRSVEVVPQRGRRRAAGPAAARRRPWRRPSAASRRRSSVGGRAVSMRRITSAAVTRALSPARGVDAWAARPCATMRIGAMPFSPTPTPSTGPRAGRRDGAAGLGEGDVAAQQRRARARGGARTPWSPPVSSSATAAKTSVPAEPRAGGQLGERQRHRRRSG